jgi:hypothetical protein
MSNEYDSVKPKAFDLEQVYDEKISPLMAQILAICNEVQMPMLATFCFKHHESEEGGGGYCTSIVGRNGWQTRQILAAANIIVNGIDHQKQEDERLMLN